MADAKPKAGGKPGGGKSKEAPKATGPSTTTLVISVLISLFIIGQLFSLVSRILGFTDPETGILNERLVENFKRTAIGVFSSFQLISIFITVLFIMAIIYVKFRLYELQRLEEVKKKAESITLQKIKERPAPNKKWLKVQEHVGSPNPSDWRLAVLEADIMLAEVLTRSGYQGTSIGEMLKKIERSELKHLNDAWDAHKIRNMIAHEGSDFKLSQGEAKRAIGLYESVFREFSIL